MQDPYQPMFAQETTLECQTTLRVLLIKNSTQGPLPRSRFSRDPYIYAMDSRVLRVTARVLMATMIVVALLVPVVIVNSIPTEKNRMLFIIFASAVIITFSLE